MRPEGPKFEVKGPEQGRGSWERAASPRPHGLGERCKLPSGILGRAPTANAFLDALRLRALQKTLLLLTNASFISRYAFDSTFGVLQSWILGG